MAAKGYGKINKIPHTDIIRKGTLTDSETMFYVEKYATVNRPMKGVKLKGKPMKGFRGLEVRLLDAGNSSSYITDEEINYTLSPGVGEIDGLATRVPRSTVYGGIEGVEDPYGYVEPGTYKGST
jgi:hypothetical protein